MNLYDYTNQAWVKDGKYVRCGHTTPCNCFGRIHEGEEYKTNYGSWHAARILGSNEAEELGAIALRTGKAMSACGCTIDKDQNYEPCGYHMAEVWSLEHE